MLIPSKYEDINQSPFIIGYHIVNLLKERPYNVEKLFQFLRDKYLLNLEQYYDSLTFLWLAEIISISETQINLSPSVGFDKNDT